MKPLISTALAALLTIAASGCAAKDDAKVPAATDLIGTWAQSGAGYEEGKPVTWKDQTLVVEAAEGQAFTGFKEYANEGEDPQKEVVNGAIGVNGDIRITDEDGFFVGRLVDGKIQGQYIEVKEGESQVLNVELARK
jgi:hypothetical protein